MAGLMNLFIYLFDLLKFIDYRISRLLFQDCSLHFHPFIRQPFSKQLYTQFIYAVSLYTYPNL